MSGLRPVGPPGEPLRPPRQQGAPPLPQDRLVGTVDTPVPGLMARPTGPQANLVPTPGTAPAQPASPAPAPPAGMLALYREGEELLRVPVDLAERDRIETLEGEPRDLRAFLSGSGSGFLELTPEGLTKLAVQAPVGSRFAYGVHDERNGCYWLRTNREILIVDDRDGTTRGRHAFPKEGFQRRIHPGPDGSMLMVEGSQVLTLDPDGSTRSTRQLPWMPSWLRPCGELTLVGDGYPGRISALREAAEVPLSQNALERSVVTDPKGTTWFLEGLDTRNAPKTLVRVDPRTLECRRFPTEVDAARLHPLPDGGVLVHVQDSMGERLQAFDQQGHPGLTVALGEGSRLQELLLREDGALGYALLHTASRAGRGLEYRVLSVDLQHQGTPEVLWSAVGDPPACTVLPDGTLAVVSAQGAEVVASGQPPRRLAGAEDLGDPLAAPWSRSRRDGKPGRALSVQEMLGEAAVRFKTPGAWKPLGPGWSYDPADGCLVHRRQLSEAETAALEALREQETRQVGADLSQLFRHERDFPGLPGTRLVGDDRTLHLESPRQGEARLIVGVPSDTTLTSVTPVNCGGRPFVAATDSRGSLYWVDGSSTSTGYARFHAPIPEPRVLVQPDRLVAFGADGSTLVYRPTLGPGRRLLGHHAARSESAPAPPAGSIEEGEKDVRIGGISLPRRGR